MKILLYGGHVAEIPDDSIPKLEGYGYYDLSKYTTEEFDLFYRLLLGAPLHEVSDDQFLAVADLIDHLGLSASLMEKWEEQK